MGRIWERHYPWVGGLIFTIFLYLLQFRPNLKGYEKVLDGVITFTSIVVGFLSALLAVILSISKSRVMKHLYEYLEKYDDEDVEKGRKVFIGFFKQTFISGFLAVLISIWMYLIKEISPIPVYGIIVFLGWMFTVLFFVLTSFRIINILMITLFKVMESDNKQMYVQSDAMSAKEIEEFKKQSARKK